MTDEAVRVHQIVGVVVFEERAARELGGAGCDCANCPRLRSLTTTRMRRVEAFVVARDVERAVASSQSSTISSSKSVNVCAEHAFDRRRR